MLEPQQRTGSDFLGPIRDAAGRLQRSVESAFGHAWSFLHSVASRIGAFLVAVFRRPLWVRAGFVLLCAFVIYLAGYCLLFSWAERQTPPAEAVDDYRYLDQGWGGTAANSPDRLTYYYTPQGAYLKNVRYDWFVALERPWKRDQFIAPKYLRAYGLIADPTDTDANVDHLPVGLTKLWDPRTNTMMVDMTCATCHSGELQVMKNGRRVAVRIDGGGAMHRLTSSRPGTFGTDLVLSMLSTWTNPFKWGRFSARVLGSGDTFANRLQLWKDFGGEIWYLGHQGFVDTSKHLYPVEDGYGRTDALGRIANNVYATHLNPKNYKPGDAPVSYPALWNTWKFNWVQYTASVAQPMARNIGESLGVGAEFSLVDAYKNPVDTAQGLATSTQVANLDKIERTLQKLQPPTWPEDLFGTIDHDKADAGKKLFAVYCLKCHGPHIATEDQKQIDAPLKASVLDHWCIPTLPLQEIGTDPTTALNFVRNTYDLTDTGIKADQIRALIGSYYKQQYARLLQYGTPEQKASLARKTADQYAAEQLGPIDMSAVSNGAGLNYLIALFRQQAYREMDVKDEHAVAVLDGYGQLDLPQVLPAYRVKPLAGMWATAPFLHNGSVPNLYELLLPADRRSKTFYMKSRTFDPVKVGLVTDPDDPGAFLFDTTIPGNSNVGHEFRAGYQPRSGPPGKDGPFAYGVIGPELTDEQRWQIIEYLKIAKDDDFAGQTPPCGQPAAAPGDWSPAPPAKLARNPIPHSASSWKPASEGTE
jgi:hypothetical protein